MTNLDEHKKSDAVKWTLTLIAFVLVFITLAATLTLMFAPSKKEDAPSEETPEAILPAYDVESVEENGISLTFGSMRAVAQTAAEAAHTTQTVTAKINPSTVVDQYVTWSIAWESGATLSSKTVTDYVQIAQESQGQLTATLNCYKSFRGSKIVLTCTTRQGNKSATANINFKGIPSSMTLGTAAGAGTYNLGRDTVPLLYAGKSYDIAITMDNIFHDVGTEFNNFTVQISGVGNVQWADYVVTPRGSGFNIDYGNIPTMTLDSMVGKLISASVTGTTLHIEAKGSYMGYYESVVDGNTEGSGATKTYKKHYYASVKDGDGNNPYFVVKVTHKTYNFSATYKLFIGEEVSNVTLLNTDINF